MTLTETYEFLWQIRKKETVIRRKEAQRDELRACLMPGGVSYDRDRVQSSPKDSMTEVMARWSTWTTRSKPSGSKRPG